MLQFVLDMLNEPYSQVLFFRKIKQIEFYKDNTTLLRKWLLKVGY